MYSSFTHIRGHDVKPPQQSVLSGLAVLDSGVGSLCPSKEEITDARSLVLDNLKLMEAIGLKQYGHRATYTRRSKLS
ncbi:hypothetical protein J6590_033409 [Homalodisca vitripennis]|nr:hypothetical protein J6590_033409 [Homalodisca vitripennis]